MVLGEGGRASKTHQEPPQSPCPPHWQICPHSAPQNSLWLQSEQKEKAKSCSSSLGDFRLSGQDEQSLPGRAVGSQGKQGQS